MAVSGKPTPRVGAYRSNRKRQRSSASDDFHNLQPVAHMELPLGEFGWCLGFTVVLNHHAARQEILRDQEGLYGAGKLDFNWLSVGNDESRSSRCWGQRIGGGRFHLGYEPMRLNAAQYLTRRVARDGWAIGAKGVGRMGRDHHQNCVGYPYAPGWS